MVSYFFWIPWIFLVREVLFKSSLLVDFTRHALSGASTDIWAISRVKLLRGGKHVYFNCLLEFMHINNCYGAFDSHEEVPLTGFMITVVIFLFMLVCYMLKISKSQIMINLMGMVFKFLPISNIGF